MLYTVNKSGTDSHALAACIERACEGDVILLIENAVFSAVKLQTSTAFQNLNEGVSVFVLMPDMLARGLAVERCYEFIQPVDYAGFVELVEKNNPIRACF